VDARAGVEPWISWIRLFLLDGSAQFSGTVPVARLLLAAPDQRMTELRWSLCPVCAERGRQGSLRTF